MKKKGMPAWLLLMLITLIAGVLLGATYSVTKDQIDQQLLQQAEAVRQQLVPEAESFRKLETEEADIYEGVDADGNKVGYVSVNTVMGFGGEVEITVGTDETGVLNGISVGGANFSETAGLGAKSKEPAFQEQFAGKAYPLDLTKNGGEIDAITAATITSSAVVRGVNESIEKMAGAGCFEIAQPAVLVEELGEGRYATEKQGFGGPVYVELTMDNGTVTGITIGDDRFSETPGFGAKSQDEAFWGQYIGKSGSGLVLGTDVDAISGATITSNAVNDAVNLILLYVNDRAAYDAAAAEGPAEEPVEEKTLAAPAPDGEYTVEGNGLTSPLTVKVTLKDNAVAAVIVEGTEGSMDSDFLAKCQTEEYLNQFVGKTYPVAADAVSGATVSSNAIVEAVNKAFENAAASEAPAVTEEEPAAAEEAPAAYADGEYTVEGNGLTSPLTVKVTLKDNAVAAVIVEGTEGSMDSDFLAKCQTEEYLNQFVGKTYPVAVDAVSGATVSSNAIVEAVNKAFEGAAAGEAPAVTEEEPAAAEEAPAAYADGEYTVEGNGLTSPLTVKVTLKDNAVAAVIVEGTEGSMDSDFLAKCQTEEYLNQFVGKTYPVAVDAVSGATVSSNAIVEAVNKAFEGAAQ